MKQVIKEYEHHKTISLRDVLCTQYEEKIIAYRPHGRKRDGLALLLRSNLNGSCGRTEWGWVYHNTLLHGSNSKQKMQFKGETAREAIYKALDANREVLFFNSLHEFITYAAKISNPC